MQLKSTKKFDNDYLFLRRMIIQGKINLAGAKQWIKDKGMIAGNRAELEAEYIAKKHATPRNYKETDWKNEVRNLKLEE